MKSKSFQLGLAVVLIAVNLLAVCARAAQAQVQAPGQSVTVQLPEFSYFSVDTSVLVPDRGSAYLGGIGSSSYGQATRGTPLVPFKNRATAHNAGAASTSVSAWVHDFQAMDEALLAKAERERMGCIRVRNVLPDESAPDNSLVSAEEHAHRLELKQDEVQVEAQQHFAKAQSLMAAGKPGVARIYFQMALSRAKGSLKAEIAAALAASRAASGGGKQVGGDHLE